MSALGIILATFLSALLPVTAAATQDGSTPPVWVAFGDSLTELSEFSPPSGPWHQMVAEHFGATVINAGASGDSTERAFGRLVPDVLDRNPSVVFVEFGINDLMIYNGAAPRAFRVPPKQFAWNLNTIVNAIRQSGATVALLTIRPIVQGPTGNGKFLDRHGDGGKLYPMPGMAHKVVRHYNDIIRHIAKHNGAILVDVWKEVVSKGGGDDDRAVLAAGIDRPGEHNDGVHLGEGGHTLIASVVIRELERNGVSRYAPILPQ